MRKIILFIKKYCYIVIPIFTAFLMTVLYSFRILSIQNDDSFLPTIIGISGTLIGFLFTAMTIFLSLNKNTEFMMYFKKYNHHVIFGRLITFGTIFLCINIIFWLFKFNIYTIIISFILGLEETIMAAYYIYRLSLNSIK
jgi:hypothetical protein